MQIIPQYTISGWVSLTDEFFGKASEVAIIT